MMAPFSFFAAFGYPYGGVPQKQVRASRPAVATSGRRLLPRRLLRYYR